MTMEELREKLGKVRKAITHGIKHEMESVTEQIIDSSTIDLPKPMISRWTIC